MKLEHNISRIEYLLDLFRLSLDDLLNIISEGLKNPITREDLYAKEIKASTLKKIDKVFNKGLNFYLDPSEPKHTKDASIFFRKDNFNSDLNIGAKKIVNQFEELKISVSALSKLTEFNLERKFKVYNVQDNPLDVAFEVRKNLYPTVKNKNLRDFLKALINLFADSNIMVFEFIETWNKKDKANINGFFLSPNTLVLKRQQKSFRREIFTLIHELGHFLLDEEEIEEVDYKSISKDHLNKIENWCNEFAYYFLVGDYYKQIKSLEKADMFNDYHHNLIDEVSKETHLSTLALYTRLLYDKKISNSDYNKIRSDIKLAYQEKVAEENRFKELQKLQGIKQGGSVPKPINSPLFINTLQNALYDGIINEYEFCKKLKIKPEKMEQYIQ